MKFWQVDAFTDTIFGGNPAAVFVFDEVPPTSLMQQIAEEMNLSETAFVIRDEIRWFTPKSEVNLCGHATLAAAHILLKNRKEIVFQSKSGLLKVTRAQKGYTLDFPQQVATEQKGYYEWAKALIGSYPEYVGSNGEDCLIALQSKEALIHYTPDFEKISSIPERGVVLTAQGEEEDYLYRAFYPKLGVPEDPVTGSANTALAPYWAQRLKKPQLLAKQLSKREGKLITRVEGDRVWITGGAVTVFEGDMVLPK